MSGRLVLPPSTDSLPSPPCPPRLSTRTAFRDEGRMRDKYGAQWDKYCKLVPYKIVPGLL